MGITSEQLDAARDAVYRVLTDVRYVCLAASQEWEPEVEEDCEWSFHSWHMRLGMSFWKLCDSVAKVDLAVSDEVNENIILAAAPREYKVVPDYLTTSTTHAAAIGLGPMAIGALCLGCDGYGIVAIARKTLKPLTREELVELTELVCEEPRAVQEAFWGEVAREMRSYRVPDHWHAAIDAEWRAARQALARSAVAGEANGDGQGRGGSRDSPGRRTTERDHQRPDAGTGTTQPCPGGRLDGQAMGGGTAMRTIDDCGNPDMERPGNGARTAAGRKASQPAAA